MNKAVRGSVQGRVQGVGFRYFVQEIAEKFGIVGYVRNVNEDIVEFLAQGEEEDLNDFLARIKNGPPMARVDRMVSTETMINSKLQFFAITH